MRQQSKESLVIVFVVGALILNYPFLHLFDRSWLIFGVPLLYFYLYLVWFVLILLLIVIVERSAIEPTEHHEAPPEATPEPASDPEVIQQHPTNAARRSRF